VTARVVEVAPGADRPYDAAEWEDALVYVRAGRIELHGVSGATRAFRTGDLLYLQGVPLRALHNPGEEPAVLVAVSR
jgi:hypothetical protein